MSGTGFWFRSAFPIRELVSSTHVQMFQRGGPSPKRLIDGVATEGLAEVQCGQCRGGVKQARSTHDKFGGHLTPTEGEIRVAAADGA